MARAEDHGQLTVRQAIGDVVEESDGEQSDELKAALPLMPEKRHESRVGPPSARCRRGARSHGRVLEPVQEPGVGRCQAPLHHLRKSWSLNVLRMRVKVSLQKRRALATE